ncbi:MAG TPA: hypothetical protein GX699_10985 [Firmicutes bacterium]|nr:hypothetical protein [Bacillota bacterium]
MTPEDTVYTCLEPRGEMQDIQLSPLSARVDDLHGKTIYFVDNGKNGAEPILKSIMELMEKDYPEAKLVFYPKTTAYSRPEPQSWWKELEDNADAAVVAVGD